VALVVLAIALFLSSALAAKPTNANVSDIRVYSGKGDDGLTYDFETYAGWRWAAFRCITRRLFLATHAHGHPNSSQQRSLQGVIVQRLHAGGVFQADQRRQMCKCLLQSLQSPSEVRLLRLSAVHKDVLNVLWRLERGIQRST
jgi:hypothetical protein